LEADDTRAAVSHINTSPLAAYCPTSSSSAAAAAEIIDGTMQL